MRWMTWRAISTRPCAEARVISAMGDAAAAAAASEAATADAQAHWAHVLGTQAAEAQAAMSLVEADAADRLQAEAAKAAAALDDAMSRVWPGRYCSTRHRCVI